MPIGSMSKETRVYVRRRVPACLRVSVRVRGYLCMSAYMFAGVCVCVRVCARAHVFVLTIRVHVSVRMFV